MSYNGWRSKFRKIRLEISNARRIKALRLENNIIPTDSGPAVYIKTNMIYYERLFYTFYIHKYFYSLNLLFLLHNYWFW